MASPLTEVSIDALDTRLRRLEYAITGNIPSTKEASSKTDSDGGNIPSQITALNERFARLAGQSKHLKRLLHACPWPLSIPSFPFLCLFSFMYDQVLMIQATQTRVC